MGERFFLWKETKKLNLPVVFLIMDCMQSSKRTDYILEVMLEDSSRLTHPEPAA